MGLFPPPKENITNYRYIHLEMGAENKIIWNKFTESLLDSAANEENFMLRLPKMMATLSKVNIETYTHPHVERLRREESFDLVVFGWFLNDYQIGIAADFKCPFVVVASSPAFGALRSYVGNPSDSTFTPSMLVPYHGIRMSFWQRAFNVLVTVIESVITEFVTAFYMEPIYTREFPADRFPSFAETRKNASLVILTSHFSQGVVTANFPSLIEASGMHIPQKPKELPKVCKYALIFHINYWIGSI